MLHHQRFAVASLLLVLYFTAAVLSANSVSDTGATIKTDNYLPQEATILLGPQHRSSNVTSSMVDKDDEKTSSTILVEADKSVTSQNPSLTLSAHGDFESVDDDTGLPGLSKPSATMDGALPAVSQATGCRTHGQVALTFSEGPSDATASIVRHLNNAHVRASFFINTTWLYEQQYAMVVQNMYNAGHLIGMAYRAPLGANNSPVSDDAIRQDIISRAKMIEALIQVAPKYVRLQYSASEDTRTERILQDLGFTLVSYNLDSLDYTRKSGQQIQDVFRHAFKHQKDTYDTKGSFISIQYDTPGSGSLAGTPHVIKAIDEEGYTAVRMDGCLNDPTPYKKSAASLEYVNDKFSFNTAGYHQGQSPVAILVDADDDERGLSVEDKEENLVDNAGTTAYTISFLTSLVLMGLTFLAHVF